MSNKCINDLSENKLKQTKSIDKKVENLVFKIIKQKYNSNID